ncbi:type I-E CRISPR-associated endoribonuclease Cas2e [Nakamurella multipartita]|uniref:CRISPR-associated protein Cas2 n=1 Tax=Nakamurella multipartita (strain ATCC 700099 / DSM 44233 / CIP 104796 / JCM 9543 / NBRC 105858 / Y-104) TaxID=479431 RepID=C8XAY1_NAKMY|nr:type I-E CRISPR-associated endoribonuclease Cas2e [Nakamurella multipartita]ACV79384.1 CRISPR-associated protein Cas2 [Nakamurella multipartita DSM 44233]
MVVLMLTACPAGLRGHLTRWLMEIGPGVFVGRVSHRVRDLLWDRVLELAKDGRAVMVYPARNEQGLEYRVHRSSWKPIDVDGLTLMLRPDLDRAPERGAAPVADIRPGWSKASRMRRAATKKPK